jgi:FkbM family methyltransferase
VRVASKVMSWVPDRLLVPSIAWQFRFSEPELGRLDEFVPSHRGAVDVGVWWGPWSWWLARRVPKVDSFEANPDLVAHLSAVMPSNVSLHPIALSNRSGESDLWVPIGGMGTEGRSSLESGSRITSAWKKQTVVTNRLDDFELGDVGFLKIDVEGHEYSVLQGAEKLLDTQRPTVMVEIEHFPDRHNSLDTIVKFFADRSYSAEFLQRGRWHPVEELDRQAMRRMARSVARHGYGTNLVLYARRYVHNFVFKPH